MAILFPGKLVEKRVPFKMQTDQLTKKGHLIEEIIERKVKVLKLAVNGGMKHVLKFASFSCKWLVLYNSLNLNINNERDVHRMSFTLPARVTLLLTAVA